LTYGGKDGYSEVQQDLERDEIWFERVSFSSKMKPRLRAEWELFGD